MLLSERCLIMRVDRVTTVYIEEMTKRKKGKLIVLDGSDGSGKATQAALLVKRLRKMGCVVRSHDFPRYEDQFFGRFINECRMGDHGDFVALDPRIASILYAADRFESKEKIAKWLAAGDIVILDRYVSANQIHQGGKIESIAARKKFLLWQEEMEYGVFGLPRPDLTIYLEVPFTISRELLDSSGKKKDLCEKDDLYLKNSVKTAKWLTRTQKNWEKIVCVRRNKLRSIENIHEDIVDVLGQYRIIVS